LIALNFFARGGSSLTAGPLRLRLARVRRSRGSIRSDLVSDGAEPRAKRAAEQQTRKARAQQPGESRNSCEQLINIKEIIYV